jgi:hypothetical protein
MLEEILLKEMSRPQMDKAVRWVGKDQQRWYALWEMVMRNEDPISRRAAWALDIHFTQYPHMVDFDVPDLLEQLRKPCHPALQRHLVKMLSLAPDLPEDYLGELFDLGIQYTDNAVLPVAVRVHAMELAGRIAMVYPELFAELIIVLEAHIKEGSAGFKNRGTKWLKKAKARNSPYG